MTVLFSAIVICDECGRSFQTQAHTKTKNLEKVLEEATAEGWQRRDALQEGPKCDMCTECVSKTV